MDRSWISAPKLSESYKRGVEQFLNFASQNPLEDGKMDCPCRRCRNLASLKRGTVRKHLLKHGFDSDYTRWVCHGEIDLTSGSSESTEKNDGDVDRGNDSKSTEEPGDSAGLPKHTEEEVKDIDVQDQGPDQKKSLVLTEVQDFGTEGQTIELVADLPYQRLDDRKMLIFSFSLYKLRRKFGWDRESFDELISYLINVFPMFNRLPICFNAVWNAFGSDNLNVSSTELGNCSSSEWINKVFAERSYKCYACNQELKSDARTSTSSKRGIIGSRHRRNNNA